MFASLIGMIASFFRPRPDDEALRAIWRAWTPEEGLCLDEWLELCEARHKASVQTQDTE